MFTHSLSQSEEILIYQGVISSSDLKNNRVGGTKTRNEKKRDFIERNEEKKEKEKSNEREIVHLCNCVTCS